MKFRQYFDVIVINKNLNLDIYAIYIIGIQVYLKKKLLYT